MVVYGGATNSGDKWKTAQNTLWEWDGAKWTAPVPESASYDDAPPELVAASMTYQNGAVYLFGGHSQYSPNNQLWTWDGIGWKLLWDEDSSGTIGPAARLAAQLASDPVNNRVYLLSGATGTAVTESR
jgi:hypothetical protein